MRDLAQADVARLGEQHRADADVQVLGAGAAFAEVRERGGEAGPAADLQQHLGERDAGREHPVVDLAQPAQLFGLVQGLELAEVRTVDAGDRRDLKRDVLVEALGGLLVRAVQLGAEPLESVCRVGSEVRPAQISGRAAVHAGPLSSSARGSVNRPERLTNTSRRSSAACSASSTQNE